QALNSILDFLLILRAESDARLRLADHCALAQAQFLPHFRPRLGGLSPVDHPHHEIIPRLRWVKFNCLPVVLTGLVKVFQVEVQRGDGDDALIAFLFRRLAVQDLLELLDRLLGHGNIRCRLIACNVLLSVGGSEEKPRRRETGIEVERRFEVFRRPGVIQKLVSKHAGVDLIRRRGFLSKSHEGDRKHGEQRGSQHELPAEGVQTSLLPTRSLAAHVSDCLIHRHSEKPALSPESLSLAASHYSFTAIPSAFILRYMWLRSRPRTSAVRLTLPWFSSSFFRM